MRHQIKALEATARLLEPDLTARRSIIEAVNQHVDHFLENLKTAPTFGEFDPNSGFLEQAAMTEDGAPIEQLLDMLSQHVETVGVNAASPRFLGYIPGGGLFPSAVGDYLAAISNRYAGIFFAGPGAVQVENMLLRWMANIIGYPNTASGNLTSGGSIANLIAVITARDSCNVLDGEVSKSVVYLTNQVHHSVDKALHVAGLKHCTVRYIATDASYRMNPEALNKAIIADQKAGLHPWLVVASAGTTNTGAVDPLAHISEIAAAHGLWFHVDGAYGGLFALCPEGQAILKGIDQSDSITIDPHKTLFLPYGTGAVLVKDRQKHYAAFNAEADYIQNILDSEDELSSADLSPELTKHFRGLRLWLPLKLFGVKPFRAAMSEKIQLARHFYEQLRSIEGFEVGPYPDLSVVTYRYLPKRGDINEFNQRLLRAVQHDGQIFVSATRVNDQFVLRAAILAFRTHLDAIDVALDVLKHHARRLESL